MALVELRQGFCPECGTEMCLHVYWPYVEALQRLMDIEGYQDFGNTYLKRVSILLGKLDSDFKYSTDYFRHKFMSEIEKAFNATNRNIAWRSFYNNDLRSYLKLVEAGGLGQFDDTDLAAIFDDAAQTDAHEQDDGGELTAARSMALAAGGLFVDTRSERMVTCPKCNALVGIVARQREG